MPNCNNCGNELQENEICSKCSSNGVFIIETDTEINVVEQPKENAINKAKTFVNDMIYEDDVELNFKQAFSNLLDTEDYTIHYDQTDMEENRLYAVLAYIGVFVVVPYFLAQDSKFAQFHAKQGANLFIWMFVYNIFVLIITRALGLVLPSVIISALGIIFGIVNVAFLALAVIGIVNVFSDKAKDLPVMENFKIIR